MTTPPDKTGDKGPERETVRYGDDDIVEYVRADLYDALQSANAELVRQVEELKRERDSLNSRLHEESTWLGMANRERDRYRDLIVDASTYVDAGFLHSACDLISAFVKKEREALSPTTNKAEGG